MGCWERQRDQAGKEAAEVIFLCVKAILDSPRLSPGRSDMRSHRQSKMSQRNVFLCVEQLEDRNNPAPIVATGVLGSLNPATSVAFNTSTGQLQVDGGSWQDGGALEAG